MDALTDSITVKEPLEMDENYAGFTTREVEEVKIPEHLKQLI